MSDSMLKLHLNGADVAVDAHPTKRLSEVLREDLGALAAGGAVDPPG